MRNKQGFSLIELLITIGITVSISVISIPLYSNLQASTRLDESVAQVIDFLRAGRERSRAGLRNDSYGVYINPLDSKVVLYQGASYAIRNATYDQILNLESGVKIATTIPLNEVNFSKSTGFASAVGRIELDFDGRKRNVEVNQYGISLEVEP